MAVYPVALSVRMEPPDAPERTAVEWMRECAHCGACESLYLRFVSDREHVGWREDMARILKCDDCEEWEG